VTVPSDDADRVRSDYTDQDDLTRDQIKADLEEADFDSDAAQRFADAIAADESMPADDRALQEAQRQVVSNVKDGGAIGGQVLQGKSTETGRNVTVGKPENVEQEIRRSGGNTGDVIARNVNTGTEAKVGEVEIVSSSKGSRAGR